MLGVDWDSLDFGVGIKTYNELIEKILDVFSYDFIKKFYNIDLKQIQVYTSKLLGSDPKRRYED